MFVAYIVGWVVLNQTKFGAHVYALGGNPAAALNGIYVVTLLLFIRFIFIAPYFFSSRNLVNILISASLAGIVTAGYTVAILAGQIETSTQGVLAVATVTTALLSVRVLTPVMFAASWVAARSAGLGLPLAVNRLARSSFRERAIEIGVLRAIGFTRREVIAFLGWELLVILLFGLAAGTCIGIWASRVFIPYLQAGIEPAALLLPLAPQIAWPRVYQVYLVLALLYFGSTFLLTAALMRSQVTQAIKMGETI